MRCKIWRNIEFVIATRRVGSGIVLYLGLISVSVIIEAMGVISYPEKKSIEREGKGLTF